MNIPLGTPVEVRETRYFNRLTEEDIKKMVMESVCRDLGVSPSDVELKLSYFDSSRGSINPATDKDRGYEIRLTIKRTA